MVHTSSHCCKKSIYSPNFIQISHCCNKITRHFVIVNSAGLKRQLLVLVFMKWEEEKTMFLFKFSVKITLISNSRHMVCNIGVEFCRGFQHYSSILMSLGTSLPQEVFHVFFCNTISKQGYFIFLKAATLKIGCKQISKHNAFQHSIHIM